MTCTKSFQRAMMMLIILSTLLFAAVSHAEIQTYTGEGIYIMSEGENLGVAKERAKADAMRNACEKAGVYVEGRTEVQNFIVTKDEVTTMTSNILKLVEEPHFYPLEELDNLEGIKIRVTVKAQIDDADITRWLNKGSQEKSSLVSQNEALRKANKEQERQIAELKRQLAQSTTKEDKERIKEEFAAEDKIFLSNQKVEEAGKFYDKGDHSGAIKILEAALQLNSKNEIAYYGRGNVYSELRQYELAIKDYSEAILLKPNYADAYYNRGITYKELNRYELAIADFNKATQLKTNFYQAYYNCANTYCDLNQYERAIQDYDRAIQINPNYYQAYNNRGLAYAKGLRQYGRAIQDFDRALQLNPNLAATYNNRGVCYQALGEYAKAQADFAKAKQLGYDG